MWLVTSACRAAGIRASFARADTGVYMHIHKHAVHLPDCLSYLAARFSGGRYEPLSKNENAGRMPEIMRSTHGSSEP